MSETLRAFIAIDLPENVRSSLGEAQEVLKLQRFRVKWVRPQNIHLTLKFLGNTDAADIDKIVAAMALATKDCAVISLAVKGIGVFPDIRRPRVIWAGLSGQLEILQDIQQTLDGHLADLGFPKETRGFKAHLTLGRIKGKIACDRLKATIVKLKGFESKPFVVNRIILFKSELRPSGAVYTQVQGVNFD
jgi:2'-5' RNA ligase